MQNNEEWRAAYKKKKAEVEEERAKLEEMRTSFSAQCEKVSDLKVDLGNLKEHILEELMKEAGFEP